MFKSALEIAQVTQTSQASWATTWLNLGTSLRKLGQLDEARDAYVKVLEIDSRSAPALGFLGLVYHLMDQLDDAIVKYHEVTSSTPFPLPLCNSRPLLSSSLLHGLHGTISSRSIFVWLWRFIFNSFVWLTWGALLMTDALLHAGTKFHLFFKKFSGPVSQPD